MTNSNEARSLKTTLALALAGLLAILVAIVASMPQAQAVLDRRAVSANTQENGFPSWYQDSTGRDMRVTPCLSSLNLCALEADPATEPPAEMIYWSGESSMLVGNGGEARLVMAVEGAYANDTVADGEQMTTGLVLVRADGLKPGAEYKITYPYGIFRETANARGQIRILKESGCHLEGAGDCDFSRALNNRVFGGFLKWDPTVAPKAPAGYLGNPERFHKVVGSPNGTNFFKIEGPRAGGPGDSVKAQNNFLIAGQLAQ